MAELLPPVQLPQPVTFRSRMKLNEGGRVEEDGRHRRGVAPPRWNSTARSSSCRPRRSPSPRPAWTRSRPSGSQRRRTADCAVQHSLYGSASIVTSRVYDGRMIGMSAWYAPERRTVCISEPGRTPDAGGVTGSLLMIVAMTSDVSPPPCVGTRPALADVNPLPLSRTSLPAATALCYGCLCSRISPPLGWTRSLQWEARLFFTVVFW